MSAQEKTSGYRKYAKHSIDELEALIDDGMKGKKYAKLGVLLSVFEDKCLAEHAEERLAKTADKLAGWLTGRFNTFSSRQYPTGAVLEYYRQNSPEQDKPIHSKILTDVVPEVACNQCSRTPLHPPFCQGHKR